jgi:hypothetical protein
MLDCGVLDRGLIGGELEGSTLEGGVFEWGCVLGPESCAVLSPFSLNGMGSFACGRWLFGMRLSRSRGPRQVCTEPTVANLRPDPRKDLSCVDGAAGLRAEEVVLVAVWLEAGTGTGSGVVAIRDGVIVATGWDPSFTTEARAGAGPEAGAAKRITG